MAWPKGPPQFTDEDFTLFARGFTDRDVPDQAGRTFLVTGANTGIGFESARVLARHGARVLLGCRSEERARAAIAAIRSESPEADLSFLQLDQADLGSVRSAAQQAAGEPRLDVLVNNAGIMGVPHALTKDGFESMFGVNHLGTFALTSLLLPKLQETGGSRVVITSSLANRTARIFWDDIDAKKNFFSITRYQQSKLANMLHLFELDRRLRAGGSGTIAVGCHPGVAVTDIGRNYALFPYAAPFLRFVFNTRKTGAWPTLRAATAPDAASGDYYGPSNWAETSGPAARAWAGVSSRDRVLGKRLWDLSIEMTGVDPGI
ncbi:MAG: oxidoreductase [Rhodospirillaceae bacterium]|nr:oxidoreductase [Rhodospirillaceae bacterium]